jgi:hypothetical protein
MGFSFNGSGSTLTLRGLGRGTEGSFTPAPYPRPAAILRNEAVADGAAAFSVTAERANWFFLSGMQP